MNKKKVFYVLNHLAAVIQNHLIYSFHFDINESIFWASDFVAPFWDGAAAATSVTFGDDFGGASAALGASAGFLSAILRDCWAADYKTDVLDLFCAFTVKFFSCMAACFARILC